MAGHGGLLIFVKFRKKFTFNFVCANVLGIGLEDV